MRTARGASAGIGEGDCNCAAADVKCVARESEIAALESASAAVIIIKKLYAYVGYFDPTNNIVDYTRLGKESVAELPPMTRAYAAMI